MVTEKLEEAFNFLKDNYIHYFLFIYEKAKYIDGATGYIGSQLTVN